MDVAHNLEGTATHPVLKQHYDYIDTLEDFLEARSTDGVHSSVEPVIAGAGVHQEQYRNFLQGTLVCHKAVDPPSATSYAEGGSRESLLWVIKRVQSQLLNEGAGWSKQNVLCLGYRLEAGHVVNKTSNTSVTELQESKHWQRVLRENGTGLMLHLLKVCSIFVPSGNGCYRQIAGTPLYDQLRAETEQRADFGRGILKRKREPLPSNAWQVKMVAPANKPTSQAGSPSESLLAKSYMFYANANSKVSKGYHIGVSEFNILNTIVLKFPQAQLPEFRDDLAPARHLSKHIFARQYGIEATDADIPFHMKTAAMDQAIIDKGPIKTPVRLKSVLPLLRTSLQQHHLLDYQSLLGKLCPSTLQRKHLSDEDKSLLLDVLAEDSLNACTQGHLEDTQSIDTLDASLRLTRLSCLVKQHSSNISATSSSNTRKNTIEKPRFADFTMSHYQVTRFVQSCMHNVFPYELMGSQHNWKQLDHTIQRFISARRHETFSIHFVLQHIRLEEIPWLKKPGNSGRGSITDRQKKVELLSEIMTWIFNVYIIDLLRNNFYVTESAAMLRRTLYFLQTDWHVICQPLLENMAQTLFQKLDKDQAEVVLGRNDRKLSCSRVRLLPKEKGVRPVVNLSRKGDSTRYSLSINQILQNTFAILNYEKYLLSGLTGSAVTPGSHIYARLKQYKHKLADLGKVGQRLYMVKLDIQACFDTINQDKLVCILDQILSKPRYSLQRYVSMTAKGQKTYRRFAKKAQSYQDMFSFPEFCRDLAAGLRDAVFVDQVKPTGESRYGVLKLLREHVKQNIVKIGGEYYRQAVGIPQGSVLSTLLCNFFYGHLEKAHLGFIEGEENLLLRLVDDFLLISTDHEVARKFLEVMFEGHPEYGCFISKDKTLTNFDISTDGVHAVKRVEPKDAFPWCGYLIKQNTLNVLYDYSRLQGTHVGNSLTVKTCRRPGEAFFQSMLKAFNVRSDLIYYDLTFNNESIAYLNAYQSFQLVAMKFHAYIKIWKPRMHSNPMFFINTIHHIVFRAWRSVKNWFKLKVARDNGASVDGLRRGYFLWLGYRAFLLVLTRKKTAYGAIINHLTQACKSKGNTRMIRHLRPVLSDPSNGALRKIPY